MDFLDYSMHMEKLRPWIPAFAGMTIWQSRIRYADAGQPVTSTP